MADEGTGAAESTAIANPTEGAPPASSMPNGAAPTAAPSQTIDPEDYERELVIDGKKVKVRARDAFAAYARGESAQRRFQEAARIRQENEAFAEAMKDPRAFRAEAERRGISVRQLAEELLAEDYALEKMTPEQRKAFEDRKKLEQLEARERERQQRERQARLDAEAQRHQEFYLDGFDAGLEAIGWDPSDEQLPFVVSTMANIVETALQRGESLSWRQVAERARRVFGVQDPRAHFQTMKPEERIALLSEEDRKLLRERELAELRQQRNHVQAPPIQGQPRNDRGQYESPDKPIVVGSFRDFQKARQGR